MWKWAQNLKNISFKLNVCQTSQTHVPRAVKINLQCSQKNLQAKGKISRDTCRRALSFASESGTESESESEFEWNQGAEISEQKEFQAMQIALNAFDDAVIWFQYLACVSLLYSLGVLTFNFCSRG